MDGNVIRPVREMIVVLLHRAEEGKIEAMK
jgi:hypothetical protein